MTAFESSAGFDDALEQMQADGRISTGDADEVRRFAAFLQALAAADIAPGSPGKPRTGEAAATARNLYLAHYPEDAPTLGTSPQ